MILMSMRILQSARLAPPHIIARGIDESGECAVTVQRCEKELLNSLETWEVNVSRLNGGIITFLRSHSK